MEKKSINRLFLEYMIPSTTGLLVTALYVIVDSIFIGRGIGQNALASLNIAYPIITVSSAISLMIGMGASTVMTLHAGKKRIRELSLSYVLFFNGFFYLFLIFLVFCFPKFLMELLGSTPEIDNMVKTYISFCSIGLIFLMISTGLNAAVRNLGSPRYAFFSMVMGALCNVILDWLFIFVFDFGIAGAAAATSLGQILSFFLLYCYLRKREIRFSFWPKRFQKQMIEKIFSVGFSSFIMEFAHAVMLLLFNKQFVKYGGEISVAAFCIVASTFYLFRMVFTGLSQGLQPILSYFYGKKDYTFVREAYQKARILSILIGMIGFLICTIWKREIMGMYHSDPDFVSLSANGLFLYVTSMIFVAFNFIVIAYYQSIGDGRRAIFFSFIRSAIFLIPYLYILPIFIGVKGIWLTLTCAEISTTILMLFFEKKNKIQLDRKLLL